MPSRSGVGTQITYVVQAAESSGSDVNVRPGVDMAASGTSSMLLRPDRSSATRRGFAS